MVLLEWREWFEKYEKNLIIIGFIGISVSVEYTTETLLLISYVLILLYLFLYHLTDIRQMTLGL